MKNTFNHTFAAAAALVSFTTLLSCSAQANNSAIENALKARPELSTFYTELQETGILNELSGMEPYTVFAPTNEGFAKISAQQYPCFYNLSCKAQVTAILRRHIVPGEKHLGDKLSDGGIYSMFSIDNQHVTATELNKGVFQVDGRKVLNENQLLGGDLYEVDGVFVTDRELADLLPPTVIVDRSPPAVPPAPLPPKVVVTTHVDATTPQPF